MKKIFTGFIFIISTTVFGALVHADSQIEIVTTEHLQNKANKYIANKSGAGIVIAYVTPQETTFVSAGETRLGNGLKPTENTIFEIASVTKALTGVALSQAVLDGKIDDQNLAQQYLKTLILPNAPIKVVDLATHSSGIPTIDIEYVTALKPEDQLDPWGKFNTVSLQIFLSKTKLEFESGSQFSYSNIGAGLVGHILSDVYDKSYEALMKDMVFEPLGMKDTGITLAEDQKLRVAQGYFNDGKTLQPIGLWGFGDVPSAGAVRSTAKDMATLSKAFVDNTQPLSKAFQNATQLKNKNLAEKLGYFWILDSTMPVVWHNGGTYGMESFFAIHTTKKSAIIIFANTFSLSGTPLTKTGMDLMMDIDKSN